MKRLVITLLVLSHQARAEEPQQPAASVQQPPSAAETVLSLLRPYATLKPAVIPSSGAVESFGQPNASAITAAGNPVISVAPGDPRLTFQVAQSRLGLAVNEAGQVRGQLEVDFVDFSKASPTVVSLPRLRLARIEWAPTPKFSIVAGQDWDLHAPVNAHGANLVGTRFLSGNTGFMRQQVKVLGVVGGFELAGAVGMEGANATAKDSAFELSGVPTFAVRGAWLVGKGRVGVSGIATSVLLGFGTQSQRRALSGGVTAFADVTFGRTTVRSELSLGRNMANIGLLGLGFGGPQDVDEWGGFVSARHGFTDMHFVYGTAGLARVLNRSAVRPSYSYPSMPADGSMPSMATAVLAGTGPGLLHNAGGTLGYELRLSKYLAFMLEGFVLDSEHQLTDFDATRTSGRRLALGGELAAMVTF